MKTPAIYFALLLLLGGCASRSPRISQSDSIVLPPRLDSYFEDYCDYTGSLGIGFVAWHTYDYRFRQHLKATQDPELKRLYVLQNLHRDVEIGLRELEAGIVVTGKTSSRPLTASERRDTQRHIQQQIDDLAAYTAFTNFAVVSHDPIDPPDPSLDASWVQDLRETLHKITNAPAVNKTLED